jgi:hypothetical protein
MMTMQSANMKMIVTTIDAAKKDDPADKVD